ncbi:unnamed protein product [marine sediment metagenome]|uniref:Uncharacterized protein n=1 Tax=marine sediment metagenome TaxID=412755 RepID=X0SML1_9ZZZZ
MKPLYLEFVNTGIASRFDFGDHDVIEMNWRLKMYPKLFYGVLMHELGHEDNDNLKDFKYDIRANVPGTFKFLLNHITAWTQVLPFYYNFRKNKVVYDVSYILSWVMVSVIAAAAFFITKLILGWIL